VLDGGQHWLRPLREFMGEVAEVMAVTQRPFKVIEGESLCHALLRFESGKIASFQATVLSKSARMAHTEEPFFRLIGQEGDIVIAGTSLHGEGSVKLFTEEHPDGKEMMDVSSGAPLGYMDSFGPQLENLVAAVRNEAPLHRDASYAVNDIRVAQAIYRSNATGLWEAPV
jgi:predicted dehydrogenase